MSIQLPPSGRDFLAYQRLVIEAASTRQVADELKISQTRVRQIVERVSHWLTQTLPPKADATDAAYLHLAQHVAADRLQYLYGQAMHGWRLTSESKYAGVILRVINAHARLPVIPGTLEALAADAIHGPLPEDDSTPARSASEGKPPSTTGTSSARESTLDIGPGTLDSCPPPRDRSPTTSAHPVTAANNAPQPVLTPPPQTSSDDLSRAAAAARKAFLAP